MRGGWLLALTLALTPAWPGAALAQAVAAPATTVRILASGTLDVAPTAWFLTVSWTVEADRDKLPAARADAMAQVRAALHRLGIDDDAITDLSFDWQRGSDLEAATGCRLVVKVTAGQATAPQVIAVREALAPVFAKLGITDPSFGDPRPTVADVPAARRMVRAEAIRNARAEAEAYARQLGMRVIAMTLVSEAGDALTPSQQAGFQRLLAGGFEAVRPDVNSKPGLVHLEASLAVEFELAP